ncbi:EEF1A lysine methyltransferase 4 isoform X2 [Dendrobium catenatum]|uniref:EEF1A lysine methyltransferase 4 isoform X2 n=1 Tax=Dendrobium catenatum TaxID=906689 RepID=UPI0009F642F2|nr:EEF1A lysine methyltransferase 4 isoform X2 [Dendrobium catenatum]
MNKPSLSNTYEYGDAEYWDARYWEQAGSSFDWYQRFSALRPFINKFIPSCSKILMVGCGNARISEDMVKDGYVDIMNIDISSIVIEMMRKRCMHIPQLKYLQMDVRDMSFFEDESFDSVIDKGTLDSLMCSTDASFSAFLMIEEVNRLLKPGGIYMLITYGDPSVRIPHLNQPGCCWKITLYIIPRAGFESVVGSSSSLRSVMEPVPLTEEGLLAPEYVLEDPDSHYIYICKKMED